MLYDDFFLKGEYRSIYLFLQLDGFSVALED
jgi:hypothetical protein